MDEILCDKHGRAGATNVCPHISPKSLESGDIATKTVSVRHESNGQVHRRIAVCIDCVKATFADIEPNNPENIDGSVLLRDVVTNTMCAECLAEYGVGT